jgi:hypothetical protein
VDDLDDTTDNELDDYGKKEDAMDDDDATDNDDEHLKTKEQMTAVHAAKMALKESKRIAAEGRLKATYENADKYQAEFHRLFEVSLPPDEDYNLNRCEHKEVFITSSTPSDSILFPKNSSSKGHFHGLELLIQAFINASVLRHSMSPSLCWKVEPTLVSSESPVHRLIFMTLSKKI